MSRVLLSQIRSLTLYKGELTKSRRLPPIPQLKCVGKACKLFQPDVVRCYNSGGSGVDIDWTCEADLPEKLRFGRVDVSCEGWSGPGDTHVVKRSCGLEYRLVDISQNQNSWSNWFSNLSGFQWLETMFLWLLILLTIYLFFGSHIGRFLSWVKRSLGFDHSRPSWFSPTGPGGSHSSYGGHRPPPSYPPPPPPPYTEHPKSYPSSSPSSSSGPGFWSGFGLGSLGGLSAGRLFSRNNNRNNNNAAGYQPPPPRPVFTEYDWERGRSFAHGGLFNSWSFPSSSSPSASRPPPSNTNNDNDRGEGPSNLGRMRRSTGYGVTNIR